MERPPAIPALLLAASLAVLFLSPGRADADVLRWVDADGVVHFTDDPGSIPPSRRGGAVTIIRQKNGAPDAPPEAAPPPPPPPPVSGEPASEPYRGTADESARLRAQIEAKEAFIRQVDQKRSLAINPYRNRIVDAADMELYNKYQTELPADRARLKELEPGDGSPR